MLFIFVKMNFRRILGKWALTMPLYLSACQISSTCVLRKYIFIYKHAEHYIWTDGRVNMHFPFYHRLVAKASINLKLLVQMLLILKERSSYSLQWIFMNKTNIYFSNFPQKSDIYGCWPLIEYMKYLQMPFKKMQTMGFIVFSYAAVTQLW